MNAFVLAKALESHAREQALLAGFHEIRAAYFDNYTDATEFDPQFEAALRLVWDACLPSGTADGEDFDQFFGLSEAETEEV